MAVAADLNLVLERAQERGFPRSGHRIKERLEAASLPSSLHRYRASILIFNAGCGTPMHFRSPISDTCSNSRARFDIKYIAIVERQFLQHNRGLAPARGHPICYQRNIGEQSWNNKRNDTEKSIFGQNEEYPCLCRY